MSRQDQVAGREAPAKGPLRRGLAKMSAVRRDLVAMTKDPLIAVDLMCREAKSNDPYYEALVRSFYRDARRRHPKLILLRRLSHGVALARLPESFDLYFAEIEAAARRNYKKAQRMGYSFSRIAFNDFREDIREIMQSASHRQGRMPEELRKGPVEAVKSPVSRTPIHDFAHFGVMHGGAVRAFAGCLIAGEVCLIERIFGHAQFQADGVVPMLIISIAEHLYERHPQVKYYGYGGYYGAREEMRRFKRKFLFLPHRVNWILGEAP